MFDTVLNMYLYELLFLTFLQKPKYLAPLTKEHETNKFIEKRLSIPAFLYMDPTYLSQQTFYCKKYAQLSQHYSNQ